MKLRGSLDRSLIRNILWGQYSFELIGLSKNLGLRCPFSAGHRNDKLPQKVMCGYNMRIVIEMAKRGLPQVASRDELPSAQLRTISCQ